MQWTPYDGVDYYGDWADTNDLPCDDIDTQLQRILTEVSNPSLAPVQWINQEEFGYMTFQEFTQSNENVEWLTKVFMNSYERPNPSSTHLDKRKEYSAYWRNNCFN